MAEKVEPVEPAPATIKIGSDPVIKSDQVVASKDNANVAKSNVSEKVKYFDSGIHHPYKYYPPEEPKAQPKVLLKPVVVEESVVEKSKVEVCEGNVADKRKFFDDGRNHPYYAAPLTLAQKPLPPKPPKLSEAELKKKQIEEDRLLAARLQVKEVLQDADVPQHVDEFHNYQAGVATIDELATKFQADILSDVTRPRPNPMASRRRSQDENELDLSRFGVRVYQCTYSLELALRGNQLIIREMQQMMSADFRFNQHGALEMQAVSFYRSGAQFALFGNTNRKAAAAPALTNSEETPRLKSPRRF